MSNNILEMNDAQLSGILQHMLKDRGLDYSIVTKLSLY